MELQTVCMEARAAGGYAMIDDSAERLRVDVLSRAMERISAAPHGQRGGAFEEAALVAGVSAKRRAARTRGSRCTSGTARTTRTRTVAAGRRCGGTSSRGR